MVERKWQMSRLKEGDYLLPSNDLTIIWRLHAYVEDGNLERGDGTPVVGRFWALSRCNKSFEYFAWLQAQYAGDAFDDALTDWDNWSEEVSLLATRQEAIEAAMRREPEVAPR